MEKVIIGMSGGVDSAVAAYLLKEAGYEVTGVTLRTWEADDGTESRCCEIDDARSSAMRLGIEYHPFNCLSEFRSKVTQPFTDDYLHGLTPNPCVVCNRYVKWDRMMYYAQILKADYIATGHYASVVKLENGRYTVKKALHSEKDQTYMLYMLTQEHLSRTLMPLWKLSKDEVREIAVRAGLSVANKPDSQEICFVPDGHYTDFIIKNAQEPLPPEGDFVDEDGRVLGRHKGIIHYTVGQRKGLGLPLGYPAYVKKICPDTNEVVIGTENSLLNTTIICNKVNTLSIPYPETGTIIRCRAKIRYHYVPQYANVEFTGNNGIRIVFDEPVKAAAPGQSAVLYDEDDCVIGGGVIVECI